MRREARTRGESRTRPALAVAAVLGMVAALVPTGCAGLAPLSPPVSAAPGRATAPGAAGTPAYAAVDSTPSSEALAVLGTIPEPLNPSEHVPAPGIEVRAASPAPGNVPEPAAPESGVVVPADSAMVAPTDSATVGRVDSTAMAPAESTGTGVPVPEPTLPIGERPGEAGQALPESALVPSAPAGRANAARPDTCWRLQIGAPPEQAKAEALQGVASSQMLTPFVIELEKKRYKVRTRDCMDRAAVDALRARAERSGFKGVFVVKAPMKARKP